MGLLDVIQETLNNKNNSIDPTIAYALEVERNLESTETYQELEKALGKLS